MKYWAFISYSRADTVRAKRIHKWLEKQAVPRQLASDHVMVRHGSTRMRPVFRDVDELAASSDLGSAIREALQDAAYLVVVCSPSSARSKWVEAEIRHFATIRSPAHILSFLVDGEARVSTGEATDTAAFSPAVADLQTEPIWVDARPRAEPVARSLTRLAAGIIGVGFDELWRRHQRHRRVVLAIGTSMGAAVTVALGGLFYLQARPVDIADCRLGAVVFRDPWAGYEFSVTDVAVDHMYLCGEVLRDTDAEGCEGPFGRTVLKGDFLDAFPDDSARPARQSVYYEWNQIKGAPCCWWNVLDEADAEITQLAWMPADNQPRLGNYGFSSIELEEFSRQSESLDLTNNPLIASVCRETRLDAAVSQIRQRITGT